jgi:hypothetical protein
VTTIHTNLSRALILCDSFAGGARSKFLQESFAEAHFQHHSSVSFNPGLIERFHPDAVVYVIVERLIPVRLQIVDLHK